ncbi:DMT family transporter [Pseudomonas monteilii]|uniref:DMT family transporter n=1 Tax=Pseudomonas monteilii TaxID=76759 RepID=UPI003D08E975
MNERYSLTALFHLSVVYVVWGSTYFAVKLCLLGGGGITPTQLQCGRLGAAALIFAVFAYFHHGWPVSLSARTVALGSVTGVLMWVLGNGLTTVAAQYSTSSLVVMCMGAIPLWSLALNSVISRTWPTRLTLLALLLGFIGLALVVSPSLAGKNSTIIRSGYEYVTLGLLVIAGLTWSLGSHLQKSRKNSLPAAWFAALQLGVASLVLFVQAAIDPQPFEGSYDVTQWLAFGYLVVFGSVLAFFSYIYVNNEFSPAISSTFAYVNPIVGMGLGFTFLSEAIQLISVAGFVLILASLTLTFTARTKRRGSAG